MRKALVSVLAVALFFVHGLHGVVPQKWELRKLDDFLKGQFKGISVSYDGPLSLSPKEDDIEGPAEEFYLSLLIASDGSRYLGTGHGGKIYHIDKSGKQELYFKVPEMDIYCLAQDSKGNLYAGTSPNGKVYKITAKDKGDVFFNPREKYIWDLLFLGNGNLLAAVGENGGIYQINTQGEGKLILKAQENHILCLKKSRSGDLIAGSGGNGLIYRIPQKGKPSVIFESPYEEIKSIALDREGKIYAAASGTPMKPKKEEKAPIAAKSTTEITVDVTPYLGVSKAEVTLGKKQPSALYKISPEGIAEKLWSSDEDLIYTLLWNEANKSLLFGTGDKGRMFSVNQESKISLVLQKDSEQIYLLLSDNEKVYALSNNPSQLSIISADQKFSGEYISQVFDAKVISSWGEIKWDSEMPSGTSIQFLTRSGNSIEPNQTWSDWSPPYKKKTGEHILNPKARYIQFKAILKTQSGRVSPVVHKISLFYLQTNIAPIITQLKLLPANEVYLKPPDQEEVIWGLEPSVSMQAKSANKTQPLLFAKKIQKKGFQTIQWEASDENEDMLVYSIFIKEENEKEWRLIQDKWTEKIFVLDTLTFPDGVYFVKIQASDIPSNPANLELRGEKIGRPLVIDNSLPVIKDFQATRNGSKLNLSFVCEDSFSDIKEVKFLIKPDEWKSIFPEDGICDSKRESFKVTLTLPAKHDRLITVKVIDTHDNIGVFRQTF
ncbi:MAG: WD40 repeat domain-containing protein [Candidatus Aminicenantes bacterium]|nr:WD40 repeat domain-containing protein [Candidatus Aminicenantes bacterium]